MVYTGGSNLAQFVLFLQNDLDDSVSLVAVVAVHASDDLLEVRVAFNLYSTPYAATLLARLWTRHFVMLHETELYPVRVCRVQRHFLLEFCE